MSASTATAQFPVVGDWANKSPASPSGGLIPDDPLWAEIDALHCNWLKVNLDEASTAADGVLDHQTRPFSP